MQVAVLAGGLGTRLRPLTHQIPKCMVPVSGKPFLFYLLSLLKRRGADEAVLCTGYLGEQIETYFGDGAAVSLKLKYSREDKKLLGTGGALKLAAPLLEERFLVVNGDTYLDIDYAGVYSDFIQSELSALIVAARCRVNQRCDLALDETALVTRYDKAGTTGLEYVNAGVMGLRREVLDPLKANTPVSLEADIFPALIARKLVKAFITQQPFYDIGSFAGLGVFEDAVGEAHR
jgi:mannose-1-phosphate guanylyltransferase